jgi:hypothetical protein
MHRKPWRSLAFFLLAGFLFEGCANRQFPIPDLIEKATVTESGQPSHITVQHILIGFQDSVQGKSIERTQEEARQLAEELLRRARDGEDFDELVEEYTDDSLPGIYHLANSGQATDMKSPIAINNVYPRSSMVPAFGDVGFPLQVGEVGMSEYDPQRSPYGWHIIKRLR